MLDCHSKTAIGCVIKPAIDPKGTLLYDGEDWSHLPDTRFGIFWRTELGDFPNGCVDVQAHPFLLGQSEAGCSVRARDFWLNALWQGVQRSSLGGMRANQNGEPNRE